MIIVGFGHIRHEFRFFLRICFLVFAISFFLLRLSLLIIILIILSITFPILIDVFVHFLGDFEFDLILFFGEIFFLFFVVDSAVNSTFLSSDKSLVPATKDGMDVLRLFER